MKWLKGYMWGLLLFLWAPLLIVLVKGSSFSAFSRLLRNTEVMVSFRNSLLLGLATAAIATSLGLVTAFALPSFPERWRGWITGSLLLPLVLPEIAFGIAYLVLFQQLGLALGWGTLLLSHFAFTYSFVVLVLDRKSTRLNSSHT